MAYSSRKITIAEMEYGYSEAEDLRAAIIKLRDEALKQGDFTNAVLLSHAIAFMHAAIEELYATK